MFYLYDIFIFTNDLTQYYLGIEFVVHFLFIFIFYTQYRDGTIKNNIPTYFRYNYYIIFLFTTKADHFIIIQRFWNYIIILVERTEIVNKSQ